jgi:hypothetical protein
VNFQPPSQLAQRDCQQELATRPRAISIHIWFAVQRRSPDAHALTPRPQAVGLAVACLTSEGGNWRQIHIQGALEVQ